MIYLQEGHVVLPAGLGAPCSAGSTQPAKPKLQAKVTDSSTEIQTLLPDPGFDGLSSVMVLGVDRHIDSNIKPENIKSGVSILGVDGTLVQNLVHNQDKEITENGFYTYDAGFTGLESVTVKVPGPVLSKVTITKNGTYTPEDGVDGFNSVDVEVPEVLPVVQTLEITPSVEEQVHTVPEGVDGFGPVTVHKVTSSIDSNILPENIKSGVSILGVDGTLKQEINVDAPVYTEFVATDSGEYNVISPDVIKYVKRLVVHHPTYGDSEQTPPSDGKFHIDYHTNLYAYWYFDFEQYNTDHGYSNYYKCLPEGTFGSVDFTSGLNLNTFDLGSVNVIEDNSLPAYGKINIVNFMYDIKHIPENVNVYIKNNMSLNLKGIRSSNVYLFGDLYRISGYTKEYIFKDDIYSTYTNVQFRQMGHINAVNTVFPFYPESGKALNVVDIHEGTANWVDFGFNEPNVNWVNSIDTFIIPLTYNKVSTFTFNDDIILNKIVCFKDNRYTPVNIKVVRESGTKQHNGTLFVPEGATDYDSWITKLNTVGTWTIKYFKSVKTPEFKGSASGYYGYTDPNTGKHLFVDLN